MLGLSALEKARGSEKGVFKWVFKTFEVALVNWKAAAMPALSIFCHASKIFDLSSISIMCPDSQDISHAFLR